MAAEFKVKDEVFVGSLRKLGVVQRRLRSGVYDVLVGGIRVQCRASDLKHRTEISKSLAKSLRGIAKPVAGAKKNAPSKPAKLDLHGMRVEEAMRAVEKAVDKAILEGHSRMEIVHGIGTGRVREALHRYLSSLSVIESFRVEDHNPGVTWVYF